MATDDFGSTRKRKYDSVDDEVVAISRAGPSRQKAVSAESNEQARKEKRKLKKLNKGKGTEKPAIFAFDSANLRSRTQPVSLEEVRNLMLAVITGDTDRSLPKFISPPSSSSIKHFLLLHIPGITPSLLGMPSPPPYTISKSATQVHPSSLFAAGALSSSITVDTSLKPDTSVAPAFPLLIAQPGLESSLPAMSKLFSHGMPTRASGEAGQLSNVLTTILTGPRSRIMPTNLNDQSSGTLSLSSLVLSPFELETEGFLLPSYVNSPSPSSPSPDQVTVSADADLSSIANAWARQSFRPTRAPDWREVPFHRPTDAEKEKVFAIDCEMVLTDNGRELARIAVVDYWTDEIVYDELVKPRGEVLDYLTEYSGIAPGSLDSVQTKLEDVQSHMIDLMDDSLTILIGHHLVHDMGALKIAHGRFIDTSVVFDHFRGPMMKPALKWLAQRWLGKDIQSKRDRVGHCPEEDARTCAQLVRKKLEHGIGFGRAPRDTTSIFETLSERDLTTAYVGSAAPLYGSQATTVVDCNRDDEIMDSVIDALKTHFFVFGRMSEFSRALGWTDLPSASLDADVSTDATPPQSAIDNLDKQITKLTTSLPPSTAVVILTGCSDPRRMATLSYKKKAWNSNMRSGKRPGDLNPDVRWTHEEALELDIEAEKVKAGLTFFCVTMA